MANNTTITLWTCSCDRKVVAKESFLKNKTVITETFRIKEPCSLLHPRIELAKSTIKSAGLALHNVNYAYIELFNRFYFVGNAEFENDSLIILPMDIDPLMTYCDDLYSSQQEVVRAQSVNSKLFIDNERPIQANKLLDVSDVMYLGAFPEDQTSGAKNYVMTVAGG